MGHTYPEMSTRTSITVFSGFVDGVTVRHLPTTTARSSEEMAW